LARLVCKKDLPPVDDLLRAERAHSGRENNLYVLVSKAQRHAVLAALESLAGGHEAVWILPEDPNLPAHRRMTETSKHVDIVRWSI
ncbi:MAG: hypothetical protein ACLRH1_12120, partial [Acutalibacteraceae bacterium]